MENSHRQVRIRVAAIIVRDGAILLVKHVKAGQSYWMLPGGGVNFGESLSEALVRELKEEVGVSIRCGDFVLVNDSIAPDGARHVVNLCFTAEVLEGAPRPGSDPRVAEVAFLPVGELPHLPLFPAFGDELLKAIRSGFPNHARYLGNLWRNR